MIHLVSKLHKQLCYYYKTLLILYYLLTL